MKNIYDLSGIDNFDNEIFENIIDSPDLKIERIISKAHITEKDMWYDQDNAEWVLILQGSASIQWFDGSLVNLEKGDFLNIKPHQKHKVVRTSDQPECIWLAIHYKTN